MGRKIVTTGFILFVGMMAFAILGMGCGGGGNKSAEDEAAKMPKVDVSTTQISLLSTVGDKSTPGGYYALIRLHLANKNKEALPIIHKSFSIKEKGIKTEDAYVILPEDIPAYSYAKTFGRGTEGNLLWGEVMVKPGFEFSKDIFFNLPNSADITDYELLYEPYTLTFDLEEIEVLDERT